MVVQWLVETEPEFLLQKNAFVVKTILFGNQLKILKTELKQGQCCKKRKNTLGDIWLVTIIKRNHYNVKIYLYNYNTLNIVNKN